MVWRTWLSAHALCQPKRDTSLWQAKGYAARRSGSWQSRLHSQNLYQGADLLLARGAVSAEHSISHCSSRRCLAWLHILWAPKNVGYITCFRFFMSAGWVMTDEQKRRVRMTSPSLFIGAFPGGTGSVATCVSHCCTICFVLSSQSEAFQQSGQSFPFGTNPVEAWHWLNCLVAHAQQDKTLYGSTKSFSHALSSAGQALQRGIGG